MNTSADLDEKMEPVGAVYKRVNPKEEINSQAKDDFWRKEEAEEESRKKVEKGRVTRFSQNEVKLLRRESQDYFEHEQQEKIISPVPTPSPTPSLPTSTNGDFNGTTSGDNLSRDSASPTSPAFSNVFIATEKAAVLKASIPRKNPTENLVRQRIKSFDGSHNESIYTFNTPMLNGILQPSSKPSADGETLSVMKRKQLFESGKVSNTSQTIVRQNPALEIKTLQEESQNQAKAAAVHPSSVDRVRSSPLTPATQEELFPPKAPVSVLSQPPALAVKTQPTTNAVKTYNLPFHIGGSVSSRLAEKINKNSSDSNGFGNNQTGNSLSSAELTATNSSKNSVAVQPTSVTVASTAVTAEFQAAPIPQHITTNFEQNSSIPCKVTPMTEAVTIPTSESPTPPPRTPDEQKPTPIMVKQENNNETNEDTTVQSAEINKGPSHVPKKEPGIISTPLGPTFDIKPEMGLCARALYDYQAADESEITFDPGEIITNIETVDEGWWEGMGPQGLYGLFPSNYVELLN